MKMSIYLHKYVVDILKTFGELTSVVNKILQEGENGTLQLTDLPACKNRNGAGRYEIDITNKWYIGLLYESPLNSPRVSIRRILYWFVDFEIYNELGWKAVNAFEDSSQKRNLKIINDVTGGLYKLKTLNKNDCRLSERIDDVIESVNSLKEYLTYGRNSNE